MTYLLVFVALLLTFLLRTRTAISRPYARLAWLASAFGTVAIFTRGPVVPLTQLDSWLGGQNIVFLIQCWAATAAFWLLTEAAGAQDTRRPLTIPRPWYIAGYCVLFTIAFFMIEDRSPTVTHFSERYADQLALILCAGLYMAGIAFLTLRLIFRVRTRSASLYWFFRIGSGLIAAGCASEIFSLIAIHVSPGTSLSEPAGALFDLLFYPGVGVILLGLGAFKLQRHLRKRQMITHQSALTQVLRTRNLDISEASELGAHSIYALLVQINDARVLDLVHPSAVEAHAINAAEDWLESKLPALLHASS